MDGIGPKLSFSFCLLVSQFAPQVETAQHVITQQRYLQVRVLNQQSHGVPAKVALTNEETLNRVVYTDRLGNADFDYLTAGVYTLVVTVDGKDMYRDQVSLTNEAAKTEVVLLNLRPTTSNGEIVSVDDLRVPKRAKKYYSLGVKAIGVRNWTDALAAFDKAVVAYPSYFRAFNAMGVVFAMTGEWQEAESAFRRSVELNPNFAESHRNLGKLLLDSNRPHEAHTELQESLKLDHGNRAAMDLFVQSMLKTHDEDSAVSFVRSLHLRHIAHAPGLHLEIGSALKDLSKFDLAAEQYSLVLSENASDSERRSAETALLRVKH